MSLEKAVMEFEREIILDALKRTTYVQTHAATMLGISRRMLKYRMDTLGISRPDTGGHSEPALPQSDTVWHNRAWNWSHFLKANTLR